MKTLPKEALHIIKSYYSDKFAPHPIAELINDLDFRYETARYREDAGVWVPARLRVEASYFIGIRFHDHFSRVMGGIFRNVLYAVRNYVLSDFTSDRYQEVSDRESGFQMGKVL